MGKKALDYKARDIFLIPPEDLVIEGIDTPKDKTNPLDDSVRNSAPVDIALAESLVEFGQQVPVTVTKGDDGRVLVIAGKRRTRAARWANLNLLKKGQAPLQMERVYRRKGEDVDLTAALVIENEGRKDDSHVIKASKAARLASMGMATARIAKAFGQSETQVRIWLRLDRLHPQLKEALSAGACTQKEALEYEGATPEAQSAAGIRYLDIQEGVDPDAKEAPEKPLSTNPNSGQVRRKRKSRQALLKALDTATGARAAALGFLAKPEEVTAADVLASDDPAGALKGLLWALGADDLTEEEGDDDGAA